MISMGKPYASKPPGSSRFPLSKRRPLPAQIKTVTAGIQLQGTYYMCIVNRRITALQGWNVLHIPNGDLHDAAVYEKAVAEAGRQQWR